MFLFHVKFLPGSPCPKSILPQTWSGISQKTAEVSVNVCIHGSIQAAGILLPFLMRVAEMANLLFMRIFATKTKNLHLSRVHFEDDCWYPMVLQKEISCLVDGIVFHGQTCPLVLQQSACDFLRLKQITSIQKRTALRIWRWTLNLIYPNIAFDWIGLSQNLQEFPASVSYALLFTSIKYPLVIYHSYWRWPIYTWFTYQKWWVVHSYVKLNQRLNPMTFQEKSWFPLCFPPYVGISSPNLVVHRGAPPGSTSQADGHRRCDSCDRWNGRGLVVWWGAAGMWLTGGSSPLVIG